MAQKLKKDGPKQFDTLRRETRQPADISRVDERVEKTLLEMDLKAMRGMLGLTQQEVANVANLTQPEVSMIEGRGDHRLSTLRRLVSALGGTLDIVATFGDKSIRLRTMG